jgi:hypothetical protein
MMKAMESYRIQNGNDCAVSVVLWVLFQESRSFRGILGSYGWKTKDFINFGKSP